MATIRATPRLGEVARARVGHGVVIWDEKKCFFLVSIWRDGGRLLATFAGALRRPTLATGGVRTMARIIRRAHAPQKEVLLFWLQTTILARPLRRRRRPDTDFKTATSARLTPKQRSLLDRFGA